MLNKINAFKTGYFLGFSASEKKRKIKYGIHKKQCLCVFTREMYVHIRKGYLCAYTLIKCRLYQHAYFSKVMIQICWYIACCWWMNLLNNKYKSINTFSEYRQRIFFPPSVDHDPKLPFFFVTCFDLSNYKQNINQVSVTNKKLIRN